jgi:hypothetical protein
VFIELLVLCLQVAAVVVMVWELFSRFFASRSECGVFNTTLLLHHHLIEKSEIKTDTPWMICDTMVLIAAYLSM